MELAPGAVIAEQYRLESVVGSGGMGTVWRATDLTLERTVAVKVLHAYLDTDATLVARFRREARILAALDHADIVPIYAWIVVLDAMGHSHPCIVMPLLRGTSLADRIAGSEPLSPSLAVAIVQCLLEQLTVAHAAGIVHRDIKPENVLLEHRAGRVRVRLLDFGIAKSLAPAASAAPVVGSDAGGTVAGGGILGTPAYMSPEQIMSAAQVDARADLWAVAVTFFEMLTQHAPFAGATVNETIFKVMTDTCPSALVLRPELSPEFDEFFARVLSRDITDRPASAAEMLALVKPLAPAALDDEAPIAGQRAPVDVSAATMASQPTPVSFVLEGPVGRIHELERLEAALDSAANGAGQVVFVTGEPGLGKTTLMEALARRAVRRHRNAIVARGRCVEQFGAGEPYRPVFEVLRALFASGGTRARGVSLLKKHAPTWYVRMPTAMAAGGTNAEIERDAYGATKERMLRELVDLFAAFAPIGVIVLMLEDLQWADPSTADALKQLIDRIEGLRVLVVATYRPAELETQNAPVRDCLRDARAQGAVTELPLATLTEADVGSLMRTKFAPNDFPFQLSAQIHRRTEGHPLFTTALLQLLVEQGDIVRRGERWTLTRPAAELVLDIPETIRSGVQRKLELLDAEDRRTLQFASPSVDECLSSVLAGLLGVDELDLDERLDRLARVSRWLVRRGERELPDRTFVTVYAFANGVYREALYDDLAPKRRVALHREIGERLVRHHGASAAKIAAELALHFEHGRDFAQAVAYAVQAGDNAASIHGGIEAIDFYTRALALTENLPPEEQYAHNQLLLQKRGEQYLGQRLPAEAQSDLEQMLTAARGANDAVGQAMALNTLEMLYIALRRVRDADEQVAQALDTAERTGSGLLRAAALGLQVARQLGAGEVRAATEPSRDLLALGRELAHPPTLVQGLLKACLTELHRSSFAAAEARAREMHPFVAMMPRPLFVGGVGWVLGMSLGNQGRMSEALEQFESALHTTKRSGERFWLPRLPNCIAWLHRELQNLDRADEIDQECLQYALEMLDVEATANALLNLAVGQIWRGEPAGAEEYLAHVDAICTVDDWWMRWRYGLRLSAARCEQALAQGALDRAGSLADKLRDDATRHDAGKYLTLGHRFAAEVALARGDLDAADASLDKALEVLDERPCPLVGWHVWAARARVLARRGSADGTQAAVARTQAAIDAIASHVTDAGLRKTFLESAAVRSALSPEARAS